ncbi:MAG: alanine--glyoxylate aminotransferase family protein [Dehalococcoidales bacterium]|nr:MAG: alanine--glyoxylate aminotransferase family protein [Dehalococcoidales bacterium]
MIIFSPGPANISERVRQALTMPDIGHREEEMSQLLGDVKALLAKALKLDNRNYEIVVFSGSGTLAIEALITSLSGWEKTLFIISNGIYGERARDVALTYGIKFEELKLEWGKPPDLTAVGEEISRDDIGGVYLIHHETTTGLINPLKEVAQLARKYGKLVLCDTISSLAGEHIDFDWGLDGVVGTANKCFRGVPGVSFAILSQNFLNVTRKRERRTYYSDLLTHLERETTKNETPFTPPVHTLFAFREALRETLDEGVENRIAHYRDISRLLREGLKDTGLRLYLPEALYSNTMTSVYLPSGMTYEELHDEIKKRGFVIYNSQGQLRGTVFMLGVVGLINSQDIMDFLTVLKEVLGVRA